jgi:hypothetical protein
METITTRAEIDANGMLRLELPTGLMPGPADVVLVVHSTAERLAGAPPSLSGKYAASSPHRLDPIDEVREIRRRTTHESLGLAE